MAYEALLKLQKISKIPSPKNIKILPEYWSTKKASRLGAKRRNGYREVINGDIFAMLQRSVR